MADRYCGGTATPCIAVVAQVDDCTGVPIAGSTAYAFDGIRNANWEPIIEEAEQASWKDACGKIVCRNDENCDQLLGYTVEFEKCVLPYELVNLLTGMPIVVDPGPPAETIGWYHSNQVECQPRVALILWEKTLGCTNEVDFRKIIFPNVRFTIPTPSSENDLIRFSTLSARADLGYLAGYGNGPFNNDGELGWAALDPLIKGAYGEYVTNVDPPVAQCGLLTVPPQ